MMTTPKIAVLIPAYNEEKLLARTVKSITGAGMKLVNIFIVNDGSKDATEAVGLGTGANVVTFPNAGKAHAIQAGLNHFNLLDRYDYVAIMDADSQMHPGYFKAIYAAIHKRPGASLYCGGPISLPNNWLTAYRAVEYEIGLGVYREAQDLYGVINVAPGCASLYSTEAMRLLDFHGGTLVEDMDLTIQLQRMGRSIIYVPGALVYTQDPNTLRGFWGQISRWYRGYWQVVRRHRLMRGGQKIDWYTALVTIEGLVFSAALLLSPLAAYRWPFLALCGFALDQALNLALTALVAHRQKRWDVIAAFPTFVIPRVMGAAMFWWTFLLERRTSNGTVQWYCVTRY